MQTSERGRKLIESFEGLKLTSYQDQRGIWTIGYGSTTDVWPNMTITQQEADDRLGIDLHNAEQAIYKNIQIPLNQNQFDALVSLVYNIGVGAFKKSTLLKLIDRADFQGAANQFLAWDKTNGVINEGLVNRRSVERNLFMQAVNNVTGTTE
jgi:lysozyme